MTASKSSEIQAFYEDCSVFITGGTGTLGKLTIEKILRSCPGVRKVYVLIRPKKGLSVEQRKKLLLDNVVFDRMKSEQPDSVAKIVFVSGDCSEPRLGLSDSDYHDLTQHVNIVLHLAATVRFDENLKVAVAINVGGTQEVVALCHDCVSLKAVVFVSTAYSNAIHNVVKEEFYEPPMPLKDLHALLEKFTTSELEVLGPKIIGAWPNTYTFSKSMAENSVLTNSKGLPASIVRPSMVVSTLNEPIPGWVDNMYGAISIVAGVASGVLRVSFSNPENVFDLVPADLVINCIIAASLPSNTCTNGHVPIYNFATSSSNPLTLEGFQASLFSLMWEKPTTRCVWYPLIIHVTHYKLYMVLAFFLHFLPGCLLDFGLLLMRKPPMFLRIYRKIKKVAIVTNYFSLNNIVIITEKGQNIYNKLVISDKELFPFDTTSIKWYTFLKRSCDLSRQYVLNGYLNTVDEEASRLFKLYVAHIALKTCFCGFILWLVWCAVKTYTPDFLRI